MRKLILAILIVLIALPALADSVLIWTDHAPKITIGMSAKEVIYRLGDPESIEQHATGSTFLYDQVISGGKVAVKLVLDSKGFVNQIITY